MINFPDGFIATRFAGYFWHPESSQMYSIKIDGVLKPLSKTAYFNPRRHYRGSRLNGLVHGEQGYTACKKGRRHFIPLRELKELIPANYIIPMWKQETK